MRKFVRKNKPMLSASIVCGDPIYLKKDLKLFEKSRVDFIHFDVMDGVFVPRFGLYPEYLAAIRKNTSIPIDVHLMVVDPEPYIPLLAKLGADYIGVHVEGNSNLKRTIDIIKQQQVKAGVVLNVATPLCVLDYILGDLDMVTLMAINPGILGQKLIPVVMNKIVDLKKRIEKIGKKILIEIDGGVTFESAPVMVKKGADVLVCGSSTIFNQDKPLDVKVSELRKVII